MAQEKKDQATINYPWVILIDQREKLPYSFEGLCADKKDGSKALNITTRMCHLKTGDYTIQGFESRVAIEKKSLADWYGTLGQGRERFERELERLRTFQFAAIVIEASLTEMVTSPPPYTEMSPKAVYRSMLAWTVRYPVKFLTCDSRRLSEVTTFRLLERFAKEHASEEEIERAVAEQVYGELLVKLDALLARDDDSGGGDGDRDEADWIRARMDKCWARMGSDGHGRVRELSVALNVTKVQPRSKGGEAA